MKNLSKDLWGRCSSQHFRSLGSLQKRLSPVCQIYGIRRIWFTRTDSLISCIIVDRLKVDIKKMQHKTYTLQFNPRNVV